MALALVSFGSLKCALKQILMIMCTELGSAMFLPALSRTTRFFADKFDCLDQKNNSSVFALVDEEDISHPGWQNIFCPFNVYLESLNKAIFHFGSFV